MTVAEQRRPGALAMAGLAVLFAAGFVATYWLFVRTAVGQRLDNAALVGKSVVPEEFVAGAWSILDTISVASLAVAAVAVGAAALVRRRPWLAAGAAVVILGSNLTTQVLKRVVLTRPELVDGGAKAYNSLPSGHATVAMSVVAAVVLVVPYRRRALAGGVAVAYATAVGVATVTAGWHRPSDAIAAWFVVGTWTALVCAELIALRGTEVDDGRSGVAAEVVLWLGAAGLLLGALLLGAAWGGLRLAGDWLEAGSLGGGRQALAHAASAAGIGGTALVVVSLLVAGLRRLTLDPPQ
jgi:membrane-associated phospholipid phosphatase